MFQRINVLTAFMAVLLISLSTSIFAGDGDKNKPYNPTPDVMHHISDAHQFHIIGSIYLPLPCIAYSENGIFFSLSSAFEYDHETHQSKKAIDGYVIFHDQLMRIKDASFPKGVVELGAAAGHHGDEHHHTVDEHGVTVDEHGTEDHAHSEDGEHAKAITYQGKSYELEGAASLQNAGASWQDLSITKNVFTMLLATLLLVLLFSRIAASYKKRKGQAPKGAQSLVEPIIIFMRDEVVKPAIGDKWEKFFPFIMVLFFFILFCNLMGLVPIFPGGANVTGNIGVTMVLAVFVFIMTNINGNKHYWRHVFAMPGVPLPVLIILTPIEVLGLFIKPITLLIRLFANITAGHVMILSLVSLIFVFSNLGESVGGAFGGGAVAVPFVFAMNFLELFVGFLQAFIFALLTSLYIGSAVEEHHHHEEEVAHH